MPDIPKINSSEIGLITPGGDTSRAVFRLLDGMETRICEGKLVVVRGELTGDEILGRISGIFAHAENEACSITCRIDLLAGLGSTVGEAVSFPPQPGDAVYLYDPDLYEKKLFGMEKGVDDEGYVWFGDLSGYRDAPVPLSIEHVPMHMAVFGVTGSGKSYNTGSLIECLSGIPHSLDGQRVYIPYPMLVIDANGDYADFARYNETREIGSHGSGSIERVFFPRPFNREESFGKAKRIQKLAINLNVLESRDLACMVLEFSRGPEEEISEIAVSSLQRYIDRFTDPQGVRLTKQELFTTSLGSLKSAVMNDVEIPTDLRYSIVRSLETFYRRLESENRLLGDTKCEWYDIERKIGSLTQGGIAILDFSAEGATGVDVSIKQFVIAYLSAVLFDIFTRYRQQSGARYMIFLIEEAQNFCPSRHYPVGSNVARTKLAAVATQGRKFGLSLCLVTGRPSFVDEIVLSMCNTFFIHRISPEDVRFVNGVTGGLPDSLVNRLTTLSQGECVITGQMSRVPFPVLARGRKRERIPHTAGTTDVAAGIARMREQTAPVEYLLREAA